MHWRRDNTGRFAQRPHYEQDELDALCENLVVEFLRRTHNSVQYPISTDDITNLIERDVDDLDLYADLHIQGEDVQGVTYFYGDKRPRIRIAKELIEQEHRAHRLRTTLTHEYGHAHLHAALWTFGQTPLFPTMDPIHTHLNRDSNTRDPGDWMEWQAGYMSGALLMPVSGVRDLARSLLHEWGEYGKLSPTSPCGRALVAETVRVFDVSPAAATLRLKQLGYLGAPQAVGLLPGLGISG